MDLSFLTETSTIPRSTLSQLLVFQDVESSKFAGIDALQAEYLNACSRKATLRCLGCSLHKQDHRFGTNSSIYSISGFSREQTVRNCRQSD